MEVIDLTQILRLVMALCFVLLLMGGLTLALKKLGLTQPTSVKQGDKPRLSVVESLPIDARRRAVILRCDDREHLVLLGANGETVVERHLPPTNKVQNDEIS